MATELAVHTYLSEGTEANAELIGRVRVGCRATGMKVTQSGPVDGSDARIGPPGEVPRGVGVGPGGERAQAGRAALHSSAAAASCNLRVVVEQHHQLRRIRNHRDPAALFE